MIHSLQYGSRRLDYFLEFSGRKSLGITVTPEMEIHVKAPLDTPLEKVDERLRKRAPWIIKQLSFFLTFHPLTPARKFVSGETHLYLGRQYKMKIVPAKNNSVHFNGRELQILKTKKGKAGDILNAWYRLKAKEKFAELAEPLIQRFKKYGVEPENLFLQEMPTRWGSCTPKGKIILNPELIKAPRQCIEYVIVHELCHLVHHSHNQKFFALQQLEMPDWEKWKTKLELLLA